MQVKLPVVEQPMITSECWTCNRMAIAETHLCFDQWAASRFGVYMYDTYEVNFGDEFDKQYMQYFSDILDISEIKIEGISHKDIVNVIKENICNGYYILLRCNSYALYGRVDRSFGSHEALIYGYDDEAEVFYTLSTWNSNTWHETTAPYINLRIAYNDLLRNYQQYPNEAYDMRGWCYFITRIGLKDSVAWDNSIYDFVIRLKKEYTGGIFMCSTRQSDGSLKEEKMYCGIDCLRQIKNLFDSISGSEPEKTYIVNTAMSLRKLYEQRTIVLNSLQWVKKELCINDTVFGELIEKYRILAENICKTYLHVFKFLMNNNEDFRQLKAASELLGQNLESEEPVIEEIISIIRKTYTEKISAEYNKVFTNEDPRDEYFASLGREKTDVVFYKYN